MIGLSKNNLPKLKKCNVCKREFRPFNTFQKVCGTKCSIELVKSNRQKEINKKKREFKQNDKSTQKKNAQYWFNKYIRARDKNTCISCGNSTRKMDAGHYRSVSRNEALRFDENNVHCQCVICNQHLSGNLINYRENLIKKIGFNHVKKLEQNNEVKKYTIDELKELIKTYKGKCKELER